MANGDPLNIAISGLFAFQRQIATTGHNIANVNTPGFSRQRVELVTRNPQAAGDGFIGTGVQTATVTRIYDQFSVQQVRSSTAREAELGEYSRLAGQLDNLLADAQAGLSPALGSFFGALNDAANDPSSATARGALLSQAQSLADRFQYLNGRMDELRASVDGRITNGVNEVNNLAAAIARLNENIVRAGGLGGGQPPNDLLDARDQAIADLAKLVSVTVVPQDNGAVNVFIGSGQPLVTGTTSSKLAAVPNALDPGQLEVALITGSSTTDVSNLITGGTLGGALAFRREALDPAQNALGRVAIGLAETVNAQHALGTDLNGALGGNFFTALGTSGTRVLSPSAAQVSVTVSNVNALTTSDYRLNYDGANYTLVRVSDGATVSTFAGFPQTIASEGLTLNLVSGAPAAGDSFLIQPTRVAAGRIAPAITDPARIALAGAVRAQEATNANGVPLNTGTGRITMPSVSTQTGLPLGANVTLTFDPNAGGAGIPGFIVAGGPPGPLLYNPATEGNGKTFSFAGYGNMNFSVSGTPASGDQFVISNNPANAVGDNRNALSLAGLRTLQTLGNGTASYEGAYSQLVGDVGATARRVETSYQAESTMLKSAIAQRDSVSAVNLDEEAADLLRFQQAFQAAAQTIAAADAMFQVLIAAVRR
jgi:flagellar hook-associated protein 1 FlgK